MLDSIFSNAISGLRAAMGRVAAAADNIANSNNVTRLSPKDGDPPAYQPVEPVQSPVPKGGTVVSFQPVDPATIPAFQPDSQLADANGFVGIPNVDTAEQLIDLAMAEIAFKANLKVVEAGKEMQDSILKIDT
jgi:flagellar basal-body rod protein FlgC